MINTRLVVTVLLIALSGLSSGCVPPVPNIRPFAEKTAEMSSAIGRGYDQTEELLSRATEGRENDQVKRLKAKWEPTRKGLKALVAYSDSLAAVVDAGQKGSEAANALAGSLNKLVAEVEPLTGLPAIPQAIIGSFRAINEVVARIRSRKALGEAVADAEPAIATIAEIIDLNLQDLDNINRAAGEKVATDLQTSYQAVFNYHRSLSESDRKITRILNLILDYQNSPSEAEKREILDILKGADPALSGASSPAEVERRQASLLARAQALHGELDRIGLDYREFRNRLDEVEDAARSGSRVLQQGRKAVSTWARTHAELKGALDRKRKLTILELVNAVQDVIDAYKGRGK